MNLLLVLFFMIIASFATFQISNILLTGSIFKTLRKNIKKKAKNGNQVGKFFKDLFKCDLCMSTQVAIWFIIAPLILLSLLNIEYLEFFKQEFAIDLDTYTLLYLLMILVFSISGISYSLFKIRDFLRARTQSLIAGPDYSTEMSLSSKETISDDSPPKIPFGVFKLFISDLEYCDDIGCGYSRRGCRIAKIEKFIKGIFKDASYHNDEALVSYTYCLGLAYKYYIEQRDDFIYSDSKDLVFDVWRSMVDVQLFSKKIA